MPPIIQSMIVKELDPATAADPLARAGRRAEEQMAFYLRRAFADAPNLRVFNGVRLEREGDAAQVDHLILHRWGMVIVESKSVTSRVQVNERGEWTREWNGRQKGMASPVLQARRQADFLRRSLEDDAERLLTRILGLVQASFTNMPMDVLVAISDGGIIQQPKDGMQEAVCKADQVPDRVRALVCGHKRAASLFSFNTKGGYQLSEAEVVRIADFLVAEHKPPKEHRPMSANVAPAVGLAALRAHQPNCIAVAPTPTMELLRASEPRDVPVHACRDCQGLSVTVEYGRYGYYFKCGACLANTPIKAACSGCGGKARIRKSGPQFFAECAQCQRSDLFHTNSSASASSNSLTGS